MTTSGSQQQPPHIVRSGELLVEQFNAAMMTVIAMQEATVMAAQTEQAALQSLSTLPSSNHVYVTPRDIPAEVQDQLTRTSLDAHLQKVQSQQIAGAGTAFMNQLQLDTDKQYGRKRVRIRVIETQYQAVEVYWRDDRTGQYYLRNARPKNLTGKIEEVRLADNALIIKPSLPRQLVTNKLAYYVVYVINPSTLKPMVGITLV